MKHYLCNVDNEIDDLKFFKFLINRETKTINLMTYKNLF